MALNIERILNDAQALVEKLRDHDNTADILIKHTTTLHNRIDAMRQYQDDINELNEIARHRPRSTLILGIVQENRQIRELQHENQELAISLEEHQSALELIMSKYREQVLQLIMSNKQQKTATEESRSQEVTMLMDKICEMAAVMQTALNIDDAVITKEGEDVMQLQNENKGLREILDISSACALVSKDEKGVQTDEEEDEVEDISVIMVPTEEIPEKTIEKTTEKKSEKVAEKKPTETKPTDKKTADNKPTDKKTTETKTPEKKAAETKTADKKGAENKPADKKTADKKSDTKAAEDKKPTVKKTEKKKVDDKKPKPK